jgi:uncharacterized protein GlcG (DUF336 family)
MRLIPTLDNEDARLAMEAAKAAAAGLGVKACIAIVDASGAMLRLERDEAAKAHTIELATRKARTSAVLGVETLRLELMAKEGRALPGEVLALAGGAPVLQATGCAGGVGVSGGTSEADHQIAQAAQAAIAARRGSGSS